MKKKLIWIIAIVIIALLALILIQNYTGYGIKVGGLCKDSDSEEKEGIYPRGINHFLEGTAERGSMSRIDECSKEDANNLREYYCRNPYLVTSKLVTCERGCSDGACIE